MMTDFLFAVFPTSGIDTVTVFFSAETFTGEFYGIFLDNFCTYESALR